MNKSHHKKRRSRGDRKNQKREHSNGSSILSDGSIENGEKDQDNFGNSTWVIKTSKIMGRYVVAASDLRPGSIILQEEPIAVGPCTGCKILCIGCYQNLEKDGELNCVRCKGCGWPLCKLNCPGFHKPFGHTVEECAVLHHTESSSKFDLEKPEPIRLAYNAIVPLRCLLLKTTDPKRYEQLMTMEPHNEIRKNIPIVWQNNQTNVVDRIRNEWGLKEYEEMEIHTVCGVLEVNAFEIGQHGISIRGVYPTAFLMSHDCVPNTNHTDEDNNYKLTVRASTNIAKNHPITLSYAYTLQSTLKRREHLLESKFFHCACKRCSDATELGTYAGALLCPKCGPGVVLSSDPLNPDASWTCNNTAESAKPCPGYTVTARSMRLLMEKINDEVESIDVNDVEAFESFLHRYRNVLHPNHYLCLSVKHSLSQLYGKTSGYLIHQLSPNLLDRKREICEQILKVFDVLEPGYSRLRGVTLYELHAPIMIQATRAFEAQTITKVELRDRLRRVVKLLKESSTILSFEPDYSEEGMMSSAAADALVRIKDWQRILGKL